LAEFRAADKLLRRRFRAAAARAGEYRVVSLGGASFVGPYRLLYLIRTGRYTQVWAAIDDSNNRRYALKILLPEYSPDPEQRRSMEHEVEVGLKLDHPRLIGPHTLGDAKQGRYLLMELVSGRNIRELMTQCWQDLVVWMPDVLRQMTEAVVQLHSLGLMHLDVKPDNYLLDDRMNVRLIDFGLARPLPNTWERWFWKQRQKSIQGTRTYIAPEQIRRDPLDFRADIYALGCTFYHMATNTAPFSGGSSKELLQKHLYEPSPNAGKNNPDVTPAFAKLIRSMMAKRAVDRPSNISLVLAELKAIKLFQTQVDEPETARAPHGPKPDTGGEDAHQEFVDRPSAQSA
jgi:eukaryotic-like serine/threonine-protein kinase